ncbi:MAG: minor capsid protein [bacterium]|nr:minor capsid protein [bacterium]
MILLRDIRDYIATLGIAVDNNCYCGKMDSKPKKAIGIYNLKDSRKAVVPIGGLENKSYGTKSISLLVHWSNSPTDTETAAIKLYQELQKTEQVEVNGHLIKFIEMLQEEPIPVDTDENGVFEYVIECLFYYERNGE